MDGEWIPFYQVDAFTNKPFGGNPAAVCIPDAPLPEASMQAIAAEMNLSETAFVGASRGDRRRELRWFTPTVEVPLCGHATLASAHVLFARGEGSPVRFDTASGPLTVYAQSEGSLRMDLPADPPGPWDAPPELLPALGVRGPANLERSRHVVVVGLGSQEDVESLAPDLPRLAAVDLEGRLGVTVTAAGSGTADIVSRFFAPWVGVDEDPVTGLAHTVLGPYWAARTGRKTFSAQQLSRRRGELVVEVDGARVHLSGHAVQVASGTVLSPEAAAIATAGPPAAAG